MDNLALNKPALQSSVSAWSSSPVPAEAARGGNDGDLSRDLGIHTDAGRDPWWQVDLQGTFAVERVCLFNRDAFPERLVRFSVLGSLDGIVWDILASKTDDRVFGPDGEPFVLDLPRRPVLRFLRVRLDGLNCLHFKECRVFGASADPDAAALSDMGARDPKRIVFSALYNESDAFLGAYITNFLHYTGEESVLLVNLPPGRAVPDVAESGRVIVFNGDTHRSKFGHTLLMGHLESFALAEKRVGQFDYFCPLASNSLFVRRLDPAAVMRQLRAGHKVPVDLDITYDVGLDIDQLPSNWHWPKISENRLLIDFMKARWGVRRLSQNQIEGLLASSADWALLHARMADLPSLGVLLTQEVSSFLPLEEILPATFFLSFGTGCYVNICHVFWYDFNHKGSGIVTIDDLFGFGNYPAHLCLLKWFERDPEVVETAAVTRSWSQALLAEHAAVPGGASIKDVLSQRLFLQKLVALLSMQEVVNPFTRCWQSSPDETLAPCTFQDPSLQSMRQIIHLPAGREGADHRGDAYLYFENTHHHLKLTVDVQHGSTTRLRLACSPSGMGGQETSAAAPVLEGYLYLRQSWQNKPPVVRVRVPTGSPNSGRTLDQVVLMYDELYTPIRAMHVERHQDVTDHYFSYDGPANNVFWFGLPFFTESTFDAAMDVLHAKTSLMDSRR